MTDSNNSKPREWTVCCGHAYPKGSAPSGYLESAKTDVIEYSAYEEAQDKIDHLKSLLEQIDGYPEFKTLKEENNKLKAQLWVAKDSQLRTYDGLAQKADRVDVTDAKLLVAVDALEDILNQGGTPPQMVVDDCHEIAREALDIIKSE